MLGGENVSARIGVFASGKGGVGKSTLSALLAQTLASMGRSVLAVEFDAGLRSLDIMTGVEDKVVYDLADVLDGSCSLEDAVVKSEPQAPPVVCPPSGVGALRYPGNFPTV